MAQLVEGNQVGKREDLRDFISIADVKDKPFLAMVPKVKDAQNMLMTWQADAYAAVQTTGVADGVDVENYENAAANRAPIQTYLQKFRRTAMVGDIAENVSNVAGAKAGELARSIDKKFEEISRDIEATLCSDNDAVLETSKDNPYKTRGLGSYIKATAGTVLPIPTAFLTPSASIDTTAMASLTEAILVGVLESTFTQYGKRQSLVCLCGTALKKTVTGFTATQAANTNVMSTIRAYTNELDGHQITNNITFYEGDFNTVELHPSLLLASGTTNAPTRRGYILAMEFLGLAFNRPPKVARLPNLGGGPRAYVDAICGLMYKNPLVGAKLAATS